MSKAVTLRVHVSSPKLGYICNVALGLHACGDSSQTTGQDARASGDTGRLVMLAGRVQKAAQI
jgi:hypothetical protein